VEALNCKALDQAEKRRVRLPSFGPQLPPNRTRFDSFNPLSSAYSNDILVKANIAAWRAK
jgi:hypothetical protein